MGGRRRSTGSGRTALADPGPPRSGLVLRLPLAQKPSHLVSVKLAVTDRRPVEQEHRHLVPETSAQLGVSIDIDDFDLPGIRPAEGLQLEEHVLA